MTQHLLITQTLALSATSRLCLKAVGQGGIDGPKSWVWMSPFQLRIFQDSVSLARAYIEPCSRKWKALKIKINQFSVKTPKGFTLPQAGTASWCCRRPSGSLRPLPRVLGLPPEVFKPFPKILGSLPRVLRPFPEVVRLGCTERSHPMSEINSNHGSVTAPPTLQTRHIPRVSLHQNPGSWT